MTRALFGTVLGFLLLGFASSHAFAQGSGGFSGSTVDPSTGIETTIISNSDGSYTIYQVKDGKYISIRTVRRKKQIRYPKRPMPIGGSTMWNGVTTNVVINADGSRTITKTDEQGRLISNETLKDEPKMAPRPKDPVGGSSYDPETGTTTTLVRNADGTHTVTQTDVNGTELSKETHPAPRPTPRPRPRHHGRAR